MKAAFLYGPGNIKIQECQIPIISEREALVRVRACAICQNDLRFYAGLKKYISEGDASYGLTGHEWAGEVVKVGKEGIELSEGDRVVFSQLYPCRGCRFCKKGLFNLCVNKIQIGGGFAEYAKAPLENLIKIPEDLSYESACLAEPVACAVQAHTKSNIREGYKVAIIGDGPMGLIHLHLAKESRTKTFVIGHHDEKLKIASHIGADVVLNSKKETTIEKFKELTTDNTHIRSEFMVIDDTKIVRETIDSSGADVVIVTVGNKDAIEQAFELVCVGGTINLFASIFPPIKLEVDPNVIHYQQLVLTGSRDYTPEIFKKALTLISRKVIHTNLLISHRLPLSQLQNGFEEILKRKSLKIIINP